MYQVIVVDDEVLVREAICRNLDWESLQCRLAGSFPNGKEALDFIKENTVDIVLTDISMPYMDGLELSRHLSEDYEMRSIQVIIFSGYDKFEYAKRAIQYHVVEYLLKPVTREELVRCIERITEKIGKQKEDTRKYDQAKNAYQQNRLYLESQQFLNSVNAGKTIQDIAEDFTGDGFVPKNDGYCRIGILTIAAGEKPSMQDEQLQIFIMHNIADEILKEQGGKAFLGEGRTLLLFMYAEFGAWGVFRAQGERICSQLEQVIGTDVTLCLGKAGTGSMALKKSYETAKELFCYEFSCGPGSIIEWEEMEHKEPVAHVPGRMRQLYLEIKAANKEEVLRLLEEIFLEMKLGYWKKEKTVVVIQEILLHTRILIEEDLPEMEEILSEKIQRTIDDIQEIHFMDEGRKQLEDLVLEISGLISEHEPRIMDRRVVMAVDYIEKNYMNEDLNLQTICSYLAVSQSNFSKIFKEATGRTFVDYLVNMRMEAAKRLLETTDLKNYEIADKVGFSDPHYFSLCFKKTVGITPKEYVKERKTDESRKP